jgi:hypothetical protein
VEDIQKGVSKPLHEMILSDDDDIMNQLEPPSPASSRYESFTFPMRGGHRRHDDMDDEYEDDEDEDDDDDDYEDQLG